MPGPDPVGGSTHTHGARTTEQIAVLPGHAAFRLARAHRVLSLTNVAARGVLEAGIVAAVA